MRTTLFTTAAALALAFATPSMAQTPNNPLPANPSDVNNASPAAGTPSGAAPSQDPTTNPNLVRANPPQGGGTGVAPDQTSPAATAGQPAPAEPSNSMASPAATPPANGGDDQTTGQTTPKRTHHMHHAAMQDSDSGHWAHQPGTGESGPASNRASNIDSADTRSDIAPHLPQPPGGDNAGPARYLQDAQRALRNHKTGLAQQALEMAETRLLDRSTPASDANQTDQNPAIQQVSQARKALASGDTQGASAAIQTALASAQGGESGMGSNGMSGNGGANGAMAPTQGSPSQASQAPAAPGGSGNAEAGHVIGAGTGGGPLGTPSNDSAGGAR